MYRKRLEMALLIGLLLTVHSGLVFAELHPSQVAILVNENSHESGAIAKHYAKKRKIPGSQIIELDTSTKETIGRQEYEQAIVQPLRDLLQAKNLASTIRVFVTTYGIPLRVTAPRPSPQEKTWLDDAKAWRRSSAEYLQELKREVEQVGRLEPFVKESSTDGEPTVDQQRSESLVRHVHQAIQLAYARIDRLENADDRTRHFEHLGKAIQRVHGLAGKVQILQRAAERTAITADLPLTNLRGQLRSAEQLLSLLLSHPSDRGRARAYHVAQQHFGVVGVLRLANREIERFSFADADASVDSELSLLWWDQADGHPSGKLPNPLYAWYPKQAGESMMGLPVMLVSRLDGPTGEIAKQLVDHALLAEQRGLIGNAYFDARGMDSDQPLSYGHYDRNIRNLSKAVQKISSYNVVLENTQRRFNQPGEAPDVALYAGWYRLRHYEDAFSFNPGSIGYHIASGEAVSLRDHIERGWCKNALERGITVTLGPISEPYLDAFPLPTQFFGLLLTGRYSLVEAFYLSSRYLSWRMVLVGDPLYNPWRDERFAKKVKDIGMLALHTLPAAPSERVFPDPIHVRRTLQEERAQFLSRLSLSTKE